MTNRSIVACVCVFFCIAMLSLGCKKGCGTCKSYGYSSGANNTYQGYTAQICINNFCTCASGLEGDSCQIYSVNKYILPSANWVVSDGCSGNPNYSVYVTTNPSNPYTSFYINNLFGSYQVLVNIQSAPNNSSSLVIQSQTIGIASIYSLSGTYSVVSGLGKMTFIMDYNNGTDQTCTLYLYQQL